MGRFLVLTIVVALEVEDGMSEQGNQWLHDTHDFNAYRIVGVGLEFHRAAHCIDKEFQISSELIHPSMGFCEFGGRIHGKLMKRQLLLRRNNSTR